MGFTENYLERRKRRTGQGAVQTAAASTVRPAAGNDFTARYLARRGVRQALGSEAAPALSRPEAGPQRAETIPGLSLPTPLASRRVEASETVPGLSLPALPETGGYDFRGVPLDQSPDGVRSQSLERTIGRAAGGGMDGTGTSYDREFQGSRAPGGQTGRAPSARNWGALAGDVAMAGLGQVSKAASATLSAAEQLVSRPLGWLLGNPEFYKDAPLYQMDKNVDRTMAVIQEDLAGSAAKTGKTGELIAQYAPPTIAALPQAALAYLTVGKSLAAQTSTAGLQAASTAAQLTGGAAAANTVLQSVRGMAANPSFQYSFLNTVGGEYQQALEDGVDTPTAYAYAALSALANSMVEVGGGIDTLPEAVRGKSKGQLLEWVKSMFDEGKEEVVQGAISQMMQNGVYQKGNPLFSMTDENAVVNPGRMGQEFLGGAVVGGVLGGGQMAVNAALDSAAKRAAQKAAQAQDAPWDIETLPQGQTGLESKESGASVPGWTIETQKNTAPEGTEAMSTTINTNPQTHTAAEMDTIRAYQAATDRTILAFIDKWKDLQNPNYKKKIRVPIAEVSERTAQDIGRLTGVNVNGFEHAISGGALEHIEARHGLNGSADHSMADPNDIARIGYILENYDSVELLKGKDGKPRLSGEQRNSDGSHAKMVRFQKKVDGTYFVVEAAPDSAAQQLRVVSAYMTKKAGNTDQVLNMPQSGPQLTPEAPVGANISDPYRKNSQGTAFNAGVSANPEQNVRNDLPQSSSGDSVPQAGRDVNREAQGRTAGSPAEMFTARLTRMGETPDAAVRLGELLGRAAEGGSLTAGEWSEIQDSQNGTRLIEAANMLAARRGETQNTAGGQNDGAGQETGEHLLNRQGDRGAGTDTGGPAGALEGGAEGWTAESQRGGEAAAAGEAQGSIKDRRSGTQSLRAIERQDAVAASGGRMFSTREYMGLDIGSERPCLFDAPEEVIRSDRVLSEVYDDIWEMGYRPHMFTGTPEMADGNFTFNGAVNGEDVYIRIDHSQYDADAIWDHERFHILSAEDPGLRASVRDAVLERYGEAELMERLGAYLEKYRGAYGLENAQGLWELSDGELDLILEELLADAYAGKDALRTGAPVYRDTIREVAEQRQADGYRTRGPPEGARFDIGYDRNNRPFVIVEEDILEGVPREDWVRTVKDNLRKKFPNGVTVGNSEIEVNAQSRNEMTYSRYTRRLMETEPELYADKLRATNNADEILRAARDYVNEALMHPRKDSIQDFARGCVQLRVGGNDYIAQVVVAMRSNGKMLLYDVINLEPTTIQSKKPGTAIAKNPSPGTDRRTVSDFSDTLPQPAPEVKRPRTFSEEVMAQLTGEDPLSQPSTDSSPRGSQSAKRAIGPPTPKPARGWPTGGAKEELKGLSLPTVESENVSKSNTSGSARFSADEDVPGLKLPTAEGRRSEAEEKRSIPADARKTAAKKLTDDLAELFPETGRKYLRDLADEVRSGASEEKLEALFSEAYDRARVYDESPEAQELREIAHELRGRRVYVDQSVREDFGDDWDAARKFFFGKHIYFTSDSSDAGLDVLNGEMASRFGGRFDENETDLGSVISRMEYILRKGAARQIGLDEQARQYGGEEAVQKFREAYKQRFMDAAEGYRDTLDGISEAQRKAREEARQRKRRELEDYVSQARQTLRDRAAQGLDTGKTDPRTHIPEGMDIDEYVQSLERRSAAAREERLRAPLREDFRGSEAMEKLGIRISGSVTDQYRNAGELRARQKAAEQAKRALRLAEKRLNAKEGEKQFAAGITSGIYTEKDIPRTMDAGKIMELADYYMGERAFGLDMLRQQRADISRRQQEKAKAVFGPALEASRLRAYGPFQAWGRQRRPNGEGKKKLIGGVMGRLGDAFALNNRTAERNMRTIFGDEAGERINQWLFAPVAENEAERYRFVNRMMDQVREVEGADGKKRKLTKAESALTQKVLEGRAAVESVASSEMSEAIKNAAENLNHGQEMQDVAREFKLNEEDRRLTRQYAQWLTAQEELKGADGVKIENAVKLYTDLYGQFYEAVNDFLTVHGYEPIGFIKGYAPHMQSGEVTGALARAFQALGLGSDVSGLPTSIAGLTKDFKPGKRWNPFFQTRRGETTDYDIVGGFEKYVDHLSDVLYHTDDIARVREANKFLRRMYAQEEISENLSRAEALKYRSPAEKRAFLLEQGELDGNSTLSAADIDRKMSDYADKLYDSVKNTTQYGQLAVWLDDYANSLAGKQVFADRDMERSFGRTSLNVGNKLTRAFTRAQVAGNLSSVLNQSSQLPIIQAELGSRYVGQAMTDILTGRLRKADWVQRSDFLMEKKGIDYISTSAEDMIVGAMFKPMSFVDGYLSTLAVRGRYLKEIAAGRSEADAMRTADRFGREVMGSRAKGSAPMAFQSKNIFNRMLHTFQLEALNTWEHLSQDLPRDFREIARTSGKNAAARALAGTAVKILLGNFLLNRTAEMLYGGTPAQGDVLGIIGNFLASGAGTTLNAATISVLKKLINAGWEKVVGERLFDDDEGEEKNQGFDWGEATKAAGSDMLNDAPLVQNMGALFGIGDLTLPMPDLYNGGKKLFGAAKDYMEEGDGGFPHEVMRRLMGLAGDTLPGGRQAEKTFQGLDTALRGGRYSGYGESEKLMYPVGEDPFTALRAALFGNSALAETGEYYAGDNKALSAEHTKVYKEALAAGGDRKEIYNAILDWRKVKADDGLTNEEKARLGEEIVAGVELDDKGKLALYKGLTDADSRAENLEELMKAGLTWDGAIGAYAMYDEIKRKEGMTAGEKATEFARWADENYPAEQARAVRDRFVYYSMVPAQAGRYDKLTGAGLGTDTAYRLSEILGSLEPEPGKSQVSSQQKARAILSAGLSEGDQLAALEAVMSEGEYAKVKAGYAQGVSPALYVEAKEALDADGNGAVSQDEAKRAIKAMDGLTTEQRAALWQVQNKSWKADNNPFSRKTGRAVYDALHEEAGELEGLRLPDLTDRTERTARTVPGLRLPGLS